MTLSKEDLQKYLSKAEDALSKNLKVDGFRKGKVPKELAKKQIGQEEVRSVALDLAVEGSLESAIKDNELEVLRAEKLDIQKNNEEELVYGVILLVFPEISLPDLKDIKVTEKQIEVTDKEIDEAIEVVRSSRANLKDKEGPAEEGPRLELYPKYSLVPM